MSNIPSLSKNYSYVIQNHALQEQQCLVSGKVDNKIISILINTGSSIGLLDEKRYYSLSSIPPPQFIPFLVLGSGNKRLNLLGKTLLPIVIDDDAFLVQHIVTKNILFLIVLEVSYLNPLDNIFGSDKFNTLRLWLMLKTIVYRCIFFNHNKNCKEFEKQVKDMLSNITIEPSVGPWASLVVFERRLIRRYGYPLTMETLIKIPSRTVIFYPISRILWACHLGWLTHTVGRFACNARVIADASSSPSVSRVKCL